ncbi:MAG TPA: protein-glutamate O-methyltransferase CheR [Roseiflexaceae bacterium]|nr:protein-glutamate O-methyltransferase CheR [Roseiflexaceae bacterium]
MEPFSLTDSLFALLRNLIHERTGLFYDASNRELMVSKLTARLLDRRLESFLDYYYLLKYDPAAETEWLLLIDALTVRETFFWREIDQVRALVDVLVPQHAEQRPEVPLRIWSAACASGEEPLTIALALHEANWFKRLPIEIVGTDISTAALAQARAGIYPERSLRNLPPALRQRYFARTTGGWRIDPAIHARVGWATANLLDEQAVAEQAGASVIFCRNVFLYFSEEAIRSVVLRFMRRMPTPGYLFVGVSESLLRVAPELALHELGNAFVYIK